jgi:Leucine-rich repeat (LRR) protein
LSPPTGNRLERLPDCLGALTALEDLSLSGNRLAAAPPAVAALPALRRLALNGNGLREVPGEWGGAAKLEKLHLQGNALSSVPDGLTHLPVRRGRPGRARLGGPAAALAPLRGPTLRPPFCVPPFPSHPRSPPAPL